MATQVESIKWVAGRFLVDGFAFKNPRCRSYFLTHFHSDHTIGLTKGFKDGIIYCTSVTRNLLVGDMGMSAQYIRVLDYEETVSVEGVAVTALPANHCPGACMLLFEVSAAGGKEVILHTGDCRWQNWMAESKVLQRVKVDTLYLDTTYCLPRYKLPPQQHAIDAMVGAMREALALEPRTLFLMAAYHIGKEKAFLGAAQQLGCKVWVTPAKRRVLELLELPPSSMALLADTPLEAQIHVVNWGMRPESLSRYLEGPAGSSSGEGHVIACEEAQVMAEGAIGSGAGAVTQRAAPVPAGAQEAWSGPVQPWADGVQDALEQAGDTEVEGGGWRSAGATAGPVPDDGRLEGGCGEGPRWRHVMGIKATGWTFRVRGGLSLWRQGTTSLLGVPYSEHSSWDDLRDCVRQLRPKRLIPTVNASTPAKSRALIDRFADLLDLSRDKSRINFYLRPGAASAPAAICNTPNTAAPCKAYAAEQAEEQTASACAALPDAPLLAPCCSGPYMQACLDGCHCECRGRGDAGQGKLHGSCQTSPVPEQPDPWHAPRTAVVAHLPQLPRQLLPDAAEDSLNQTVLYDEDEDEGPCSPLLDTCCAHPASVHAATEAIAYRMGGGSMSLQLEAHEQAPSPGILLEPHGEEEEDPLVLHAAPHAVQCCSAEEDEEVIVLECEAVQSGPQTQSAVQLPCQSGAAVGIQGAEVVDLNGVDMDQQQRIWEEIQRSVRRRQQQEVADGNKAKAPRRTRKGARRAVAEDLAQSDPLSGSKRRRPADSGSAYKTPRPAAVEAVQVEGGSTCPGSSAARSRGILAYFRRMSPTPAS